jgi:hypothetical protein
MITVELKLTATVKVIFEDGMIIWRHPCKELDAIGRDDAPAVVYGRNGVSEWWTGGRAGAPRRGKARPFLPPGEGR